MSIIYETFTSVTGQDFIRRSNENGSFSYIPTDLENADYQQYLNKDKPQVIEK